MSLKEKYADKIAKLLAKAESTTPGEAELLTAKAQELMAQYAIDEAMIEAARGFSESKGKITEEEFISIGIYRFPLAQIPLVVFAVNDIPTFQWSGKNPRTIDGKLYKETVVQVGVGYKSDLDRARVLISSLQLQAVLAENAWWKKNKQLYEDEPKGGHYVRRQFLFSFANGVHSKLQEAADRGRKAAEEEHSTGSVALVLRDKNQMVMEEFGRLHPDLRKSHARYAGGDPHAAAAGREAGRNADVGQPRVGGGRSALNR